MTGSNGHAGSRAYKTGVAVAILTAFLTVWTTVVRDDGSGAGFFLVIMAAGVGGFAALFRAAGMARTMAGVAAMQACFALAIATAPSTATLPDGGFRMLLFSALFTAAWLVSAMLFRAAARSDPETAPR